jgi:hypothetical protein
MVFPAILSSSEGSVVYAAGGVPMNESFDFEATCNGTVETGNA